MLFQEFGSVSGFLEGKEGEKLMDESALEQPPV